MGEMQRRRNVLRHYVVVVLVVRDWSSLFSVDYDCRGFTES